MWFSRPTSFCAMPRSLARKARFGGYWWLVHFSRFYHLQIIDIQRYYKILYRDTNPWRDKNGTKPQEIPFHDTKVRFCPVNTKHNPINLLQICCQTILSAELFFWGRYIKCRNSTSAIWCKIPVKICLTAFVHYGYFAVGQCVSKVYKLIAAFVTSKCMPNQDVT